MTRYFVFFFSVILMTGCSAVHSNKTTNNGPTVFSDTSCNQLYAYAIDQDGDLVRCVHREEDAI